MISEETILNHKNVSGLIDLERTLIKNARFTELVLVFIEND